MWWVKTIFVFVVTQILFGAAQEKKEIFLGGVFDQPETEDPELLSDQQAFEFAVDFANDYISSDFVFTALTEETDVRTSGPFKARMKTCSLVNRQALVIFGPKEEEEIDIVQSICDYKDIAHVITRWVYNPSDHRSIINFYPHSSYLTLAYFSVLKQWDWKSFTLFYQDNESVLRMGDLINMAKNEGVVVSVKQLDENDEGIYRTTLKQALHSGERNFVIDCTTSILEEVLRQAQQVGLMTNHYNYFITNLDMQTLDLEPFQFSEANFTGIRILNPDSQTVTGISLLIKKNHKEFNKNRMETNTALLIDAVQVLTSVISTKLSVNNMEMSNVSCSSQESSRYGYTISNHVKTSKEDGMTGLIEFDGSGYRSNFNLELIELRENGINKIGTWNMSKGLITASSKIEHFNEDSDSLRNRTFKVITCLTDPYCMLKETSGQLFGNDRFEGFAIDLIHELSVMEGFNYTFIIREDKKNGALNETTKQWSGMIGDVMDGTADLAITDLTITAEREEAVDFTSPFMNLGISILAKKPGNAPPSFFSFADPFAIDTWIMLALAYAVVSLSFFILGRLCPDEWTNPYPCIEEPEFLINQFSLPNSAWFAVGSLMQQGTEIAPIAISTRMLSGMWWFFVLIMVSSYTASLAAFLATENTISLFSDVESLVENQEKNNLRMGAKANGATESFFKGKEDKNYQAIAEYMKNHPKDMVKENKDGVLLAIEGNYAFFMESTSIEYEIQRHCELQQYGNLLDDKGYGIAMRKNSTYRKKLSTAILKFQSSGALDILKRKWWEEKRGGGQCSASSDDGTPPLGLQNVEGVFYVTIVGTIIACFLVIVEMIIATYKVSSKTKLSYKETLKLEMKAFFEFTSNVKPAIQAKSKSGSKSSKETASTSHNNLMAAAPATYGFIPAITKDELSQ